MSCRVDNDKRGAAVLRELRISHETSVRAGARDRYPDHQYHPRRQSRRGLGTSVSTAGAELHLSARGASGRVTGMRTCSDLSCEECVQHGEEGVRAGHALFGTRGVANILPRVTNITRLCKRSTDNDNGSAGLRVDQMQKPETRM
eukprot:6199190-Pleurochrysis_carterae.AAC.6